LAFTTSGTIVKRGPSLVTNGAPPQPDESYIDKRRLEERTGAKGKRVGVRRARSGERQRGGLT